MLLLLSVALASLLVVLLLVFLGLVLFVVVLALLFGLSLVVVVVLLQLHQLLVLRRVHLLVEIVASLEALVKLLSRLRQRALRLNLVYLRQSVDGYLAVLVYIIVLEVAVLDRLLHLIDHFF